MGWALKSSVLIRALSSPWDNHRNPSKSEKMICLPYLVIAAKIKRYVKKTYFLDLAQVFTTWLPSKIYNKMNLCLLNKNKEIYFKKIDFFYVFFSLNLMLCYRRWGLRYGREIINLSLYALQSENIFHF